MHGNDAGVAVATKALDALMAGHIDDHLRLVSQDVAVLRPEHETDTPIAGRGAYRDFLEEWLGGSTGARFKWFHVFDITVNKSSAQNSLLTQVVALAHLQVPDLNLVPLIIQARSGSCSLCESSASLDGVVVTHGMDLDVALTELDDSIVSILFAERSPRNWTSHIHLDQDRIAQP